MGDSNPMSDFIVPLLSFLVVLTASVLLFAKLGTMDLPSKADLMTLVLPTNLGGGDDDGESGGGFFGLIRGNLALVIILCLYAALVISLIAVSAVLCPIPLAGGLMVSLGIIGAMMMRLGSSSGTQTVSAAILLACIYSAYASWKKFSALIQFSGGEVSSAGAAGFMFIVALALALVAYNVVVRDQADMRDQLLGNLFSNVGFEGEFKCTHDDTELCMNDILEGATQQMAKKQVSGSVEGQLGCKGSDQLRPCVRGMVRRQLPSGVTEDQVEDQTDTSMGQILNSYGVDTRKDWSTLTVDDLVDEVVKTSPQVRQQMEDGTKQLKDTMGMVVTMLDYLPYITAFIVFTTTMFTQSLVRPLTSFLSTGIFSALLAAGIVSTVQHTVTVDRYVVTIGRSATVKTKPKKRERKHHKPLPKVEPAADKPEPSPEPRDEPELAQGSPPEPAPRPAAEPESLSDISAGGGAGFDDL
ncbi:MAG: hypothetical protein QGG26_08170 [Candidatus Undinarchaeales archaeon]|jgi:hypothetical protein|nr:hypothetical protein [Candidatus Undinarchaeales archaeon]